MGGWESWGDVCHEVPGWVLVRDTRTLLEGGRVYDVYIYICIYIYKTYIRIYIYIFIYITSNVRCAVDREFLYIYIYIYIGLYFLGFPSIWNSSPDLPDLPKVNHLLRFGISSTRAGGQDDVSFNKLPQNILIYSYV